MAILFDTDEELGIKEYWDYDPINDTFAIATEQDVTGFLDRMQKIRNDVMFGATASRKSGCYTLPSPQ